MDARPAWFAIRLGGQRSCARSEGMHRPTSTDRHGETHRTVHEQRRSDPDWAAIQVFERRRSRHVSRERRRRRTRDAQSRRRCGHRRRVRRRRRWRSGIPRSLHCDWLCLQNDFAAHGLRVKRCRVANASEEVRRPSDLRYFSTRLAPPKCRAAASQDIFLAQVLPLHSVVLRLQLAGLDAAEGLLAQLTKIEGHKAEELGYRANCNCAQIRKRWRRAYRVDSNGKEGQLRIVSSV